jgi:pimeloyl-ACP methyl ester carboxylesterase
MKSCVPLLALIFILFISHTANADTLCHECKISHHHKKKCKEKTGFVTRNVSGDQGTGQVKIFYRQRGNCKPGTKSIIFLHSLGSNSTSWKCQQTELCDCFCTIAIDFRGHGNSPANFPVSYSALTDDLKAVIDELGLEKPTIVGASLIGAYVAQIFATRYPDSISRIALVGPTPQLVATPDFPLGVPPLLYQQLLFLLINDIQQFAQIGTDLILNDTCQDQTQQFRQRLINSILSSNQQTLITLLTELGTLSLISNLNHINLPTLVLVGGDSSIFSPAVGQFINSNIPRSLFYGFPGKGDFFPVESVKKFNRLIAEFVGSCCICETALKE